MHRCDRAPNHQADVIVLTVTTLLDDSVVEIALVPEEFE